MTLVAMLDLVAMLVAYILDVVAMLHCMHVPREVTHSDAVQRGGTLSPK